MVMLLRLSVIRVLLARDGVDSRVVAHHTLDMSRGGFYSIALRQRRHFLGFGVGLVIILGSVYLHGLRRCRCSGYMTVVYVSLKIEANMMRSE